MDHTTRTLAGRVLQEGLVETSVLAPTRVDASFRPPEGYELLELVGRGGGGVVYRARELGLDRLVAIKYLRGVSVGDLERFRREARFAARIDNPSIVKIYGLGEVDDTPYIAMQYVDGGSLGGRTMPAGEAARVIRDVASALTHAHAEGIVHRDIKPENILLDGDGRVYVTDFGIARDLRGRVGETMSHDGQIMGTPGLMPPEQARGDVAAVDARSDVYALGASLYRVVTGRNPFDGESLVDVLHAVIHDPLVLPRSHNAAVPRGLEEIIVRCLAKPREARFPSMRAVVEALDAFLAGGRAPGGGSAWFRQLVGVPAPAHEDVEGEQRLGPEWQEGLELIRALAAWDSDLYRVSGSLAPSFARLDAIRERLEVVVQARPDAAWARFYRGVALFRRGRLDEAADEMERSVDRVADAPAAFFELGRLYLALYLCERRRARKHLSVFGVRSGLDQIRGRLDQAALAFDEMRRAGGDQPSWHQAYARAASRFAEGNPEACLAACDEGLAIDPDREELWRLRGDAARAAGVDPHASYDQALLVRRSDYETLLAKAEAYREEGRLTDARATLERAQQIHPEHAELAALLARTHLDEDADATTLTTALDLAELACRLDPASYEATVTLAETHLERGRRQDDIGSFDAALRVLTRATTLAGCQNRVMLLTARARFERATRGETLDRSELEAVATLCRETITLAPDHDAWRTLLEDVERTAGR